MTGEMVEEMFFVKTKNNDDEVDVIIIRKYYEK